MKWKWLRSVAKHAISQVPPNDLLFRACRLYVDKCNGENNCDAYNNGEFQFLRERLRECRVVFDVGANHGDWAKMALDVSSSIELHCFEPNPATFRHLQRCGLPSNVKLNNLGLGSAQGSAELFLFGETSGMNSLHRRDGLGALGIETPVKTETVKLARLDDYCSEHGIEQVDFLKLDVEGHELEALRGAAEMLRLRRIKIVQFEYGGCHIDSRVFLKDIWSCFDGLDFEFFKLYPNGLKRFAAYSQDMERFQYQNWAVIRNDTAGKHA